MRDVEFLGERFAISDAVGLMPLMRFAKVAKTGVDSDEMEGLVAMYDLIEQCLATEEWERFQTHATAKRADGEQLMAFVAKVIGELTERPTQRPSDSSDGPSSTGQSSTDDLSSRVKARLEEQGRPELALMVVQAEEARSA